MRALGLAVAFLAAVAAPIAGAIAAPEIATPPAFEDAALQARYETLTRELRCLVCQNQSIADSHALLAADLRREVHGMLSRGASDAEVIEFMVARYGDFVLYEPPVRASTWLLWWGPFLLLALGAFAVWRALRKRAELPDDGGNGG
jgi:cytochrome c-type biogenesis protein CcmH